MIENYSNAKEDFLCKFNLLFNQKLVNDIFLALPRRNEIYINCFSSHQELLGTT